MRPNGPSGGLATAAVRRDDSPKTLRRSSSRWTGSNTVGGQCVLVGERFPSRAVGDPEVFQSVEGKVTVYHSDFESSELVHETCNRVRPSVSM